MKKKIVKPKSMTCWAVYDKDDGRITYVAEQEDVKPTPSYKFQGVCRVRVSPIRKLK